MDTEDTYAAFFNLLLQLVQKTIRFLRLFSFFLIRWKNDPFTKELMQYISFVYAQVPESVVLAATASVVFASTFFILRLGRSLLVLLFFLLQLVTLLTCGFVAWHFRANIWDLLDWMLK